MIDLGLVSIITPSYNCSKFISTTIASIQAQTYTNWELLITDDCSTDNSREIIENFSRNDSRIKLFTLQKNSGAGIARNESIKNSSGRYIAFCDSDDFWTAEKLEKQLFFMKENGIDLSFSSYLTCDENGNNIGIIVCPKKVSYKSIQKDDKIGCLTLIYDTRNVGKVYLPDLRKRQDWAMKLKILEKCKYGFGIKEPLATYRLSQNSLSSNKKQLIKYNIAVYTDVLKWSKLRAYLFFTFVFIPNYFAKKYLQKIVNR